jgi:hypothetical protein
LSGEFKVNVLWRCLIAPVALSLSACSLITSPLVAGVQLASTAVTSVANMAPNTSTNGMAHPHDELRNICIELNSTVIMRILFPNCKTAARPEIESRIYAVGNAPANCDALLYYTVLTQWGSPMFSDELRPISPISICY